MTENAMSRRLAGRAPVILLLSAAVLTVGLIALFNSDGFRNEEPAGASVEAAENKQPAPELNAEAPEEAFVSEPREPEELPQTNDGLNDRAAVQSDPEPSVHGRVLDEDGSDIEGARISWTAWDSAYIPFVTSAVNIPREAIAARSAEVQSVANGSFSFAEKPPLVAGEPSFIWISHPSYQAQVIEIAAGISTLAEEQVVTLLPAQGVLVRVMENGRGTADAEVIQQASFPRGSKAQYDGGVHAPKARLVFMRTYQTGPGGTTAIAPCEHKHHLQAKQGDLISMPWEGLGRAIINLELAPTFSLLGVVDLPDELDPAWGKPRIQVLRFRASIVEEVGSITIQDDGAFGPARIPAVNADQFAARLEGSEFVLTEERFEPPRIGDEVFIQLKAQKGDEVWFLVLDEADKPIPRATVLARWQQQGVSYDKTVTGRDDGYVMVPGIPPGSLSGSVTADGRALVNFGSFPVPVDPPAAQIFNLRPGNQLRGRCMRGTEPVSDFELRFWPARIPTMRGAQTVLDSNNGEFLIENLPSPNVSIMAIAPDFGRSETITIDLEQGAEREALLQINPPRSITGSIQDATTRLPISGAMVTVYASHIYAEMDPIGGPVVADANGQFEVERLGDGINVIFLHAPGYSSRELKVYVNEQTPIDLGTLELVSCQTLTARLILPDGKDPSEWVLRAKGGLGAIPMTPFDSHGELRIENASEGSWTFEAYCITTVGLGVATQTHWLRKGEDWHLEFDFVGGRSLVIKTSGEVPSSSTDSLMISLSYEGLNGQRCERRIWHNEDGVSRIVGGVAPGPVLVQLGSSPSGIMRSGIILHEINESDPDEVVVNVPLVVESGLRVQVVDTKDKALPGIMVVLRTSSFPKLLVSHGMTDGNGELLITRIPEETGFADLTSPSGGIHHGIEFSLPSRDDEVLEFVFDMNSSIKLLLVDDGIPQPTVTCRLWSLDDDLCMTSGQSPDASGRLELKNLCPGSYQLRVDGYDHWPVKQEVTAQPGGGNHVIEVRRVAELELEFVQSSGAPFANQTIGLECESMGENAADWAAAGKLPGFGAGLTTDGQGFLSLARVPHGNYRWTAAGASGTLTLVAGERLTRRVVIP